MHVQNKKYRNFVPISRLPGKQAAQKFKNFCRPSLWTCLHHTVILRNQYKIPDFLMILAFYATESQDRKQSFENKNVCKN